MAVGTGVEAGMECMAEQDIAGALLFILQFPHRMTFGALFYRKSLLCVVAHPARFPLRHGGHSDTLVLLSR